MKQHLNIQKFWRESENAVRIQIYAAITAYCMVAIVQHDIGAELLIFEVLETVSLVLADRIHLVDLFAILISKKSMNLLVSVNQLYLIVTLYIHMNNIDIMERRFDFPEDFNLDPYFEDCFRVIRQGDIQTVRIKVTKQPV